MPIFVFFVIFAVLSMYFSRRAEKIRNARIKAFWDREREADSVRRKDISNLDYITISYDLLPFDENADYPIKNYQDKILELKDEKILNLTGFTNTDLKMEYGPANLEDLTVYDQNYTALASNLGLWTKELYSHIDDGKYGSHSDVLDKVRTLCEYSISICSDVSYIYTILGEIYLSEDRVEDIYDLMDKAGDLKTLMKDSIVENLHKLLSQD